MSAPETLEFRDLYFRPVHITHNNTYKEVCQGGKAVIFGEYPKKVLVRLQLPPPEPQYLSH